MNRRTSVASHSHGLIYSRRAGVGQNEEGGLPAGTFLHRLDEARQPEMIYVQPLEFIRVSDNVIVGRLTRAEEYSLVRITVAGRGKRSRTFEPLGELRDFDVTSDGTIIYCSDEELRMIDADGIDRVILDNEPHFASVIALSDAAVCYTLIDIAKPHIERVAIAEKTGDKKGFKKIVTWTFEAGVLKDTYEKIIGE